MNCGKESSQSYLAGLLQLQFYNIFTMFFPLFSKDFTDILRINYLKYVIKRLIIVKQANSIFQLHLAFDLYPY